METLTPVNGRQSFYGKCEMIEDDNKVILKSYVANVATYNKDTKKMTINGWYSHTTASHINSFLNYFGFNTTNKQGIEDWQPQTKEEQLEEKAKQIAFNNKA